MRDLLAATEDKRNPKLLAEWGSRPRVVAVDLYAKNVYGSDSKGNQVTVPGPHGFEYRCPGCGRDHRSGIRYPLPRLVNGACGMLVLVMPPDDGGDAAG